MSVSNHNNGEAKQKYHLPARHSLPCSLPGRRVGAACKVAADPGTRAAVKRGETPRSLASGVVLALPEVAAALQERPTSASCRTMIQEFGLGGTIGRLHCGQGFCHIYTPGVRVPANTKRPDSGRDSMTPSTLLPPVQIDSGKPEPFAHPLARGTRVHTKESTCLVCDKNAVHARVAASKLKLAIALVRVKTYHIWWLSNACLLQSASPLCSTNLPLTNSAETRACGRRIGNWFDSA